MEEHVFYSAAHTAQPKALLRPNAERTTKTPSKQRSLSDSAPTLSPSPNFKEDLSRAKDDSALISTPSKISRRNTLGARVPYLHMPGRDPSLDHTNNNSTQSDPHDIYTSPTNVLPRHSRGLDFSRARTHLHHSIVADQSSPDSSPTVTHKSIPVPSRRQSNISMMMDSPRSNMWSNNLGADRGFHPRSLGSTTAITSDASSSSSDDEDTFMRHDESEDTIMTTPMARKSDAGSAITPYGIRASGSMSGWMSSHSPMARGLVQFRQGANTTDGTVNDVDFATNTEIANDVTMTSPLQRPMSRRESLSLHANTLRISSSNESSDDSAFVLQPPSTPGVVRRPVTRRSNMFPKTKGFARVRAALQEETVPGDSDARREAEIVRQVRVKDVGLGRGQSTASSSPDLIPTIPHLNTSTSDLPDIEELSSTDQFKKFTDDRRPSNYFGLFGHGLHSRMQTPPPPLFGRARSSSNMSEDRGDSPSVSTPPSVAMSITPTIQAEIRNELPNDQITFPPPSLPSVAEMSRKNGKRRRDDDLDPISFKRRAVSPGMMSVQSSPILSQSPVSSSGGWWSQTKNTREGSGSGTADERSASTGSLGQAPPVTGPTRVGFQGMTDTNDGLMNMSIE